MSTGGADDLTIKLRMDNSDALAKTQATDAAFGKTTAGVDADMKRLDATIRRAANGQFVAINKTRGAVDQTGKSIRKMGDEFRRADGAASGFADSMKAIALQHVEFGSIVAGITAVGRSWAEANKQLDDYAKDLIKVKDDLKELATLRGLASASDDFIKKLGGFSRQTGLSISQSDEFQRNLYGSVAAGQQSGNIDKETTEMLSVEAGKVAARQTKDMKTRGDLIGVLPQFRKYQHGKTGVQEALSDAESVRLGLTEGRGDDGPLTQALLNVAGSLAGEGKMVGSLPELAALVGVQSLSGGASQADTRTDQLVRGVRGETPEQQKFLKSFAGIDEHDNLEQRLDKLVPALLRKQAEGRDIPAFLTESGINSEQGRAIAEMLPNLGVFKERLATARKGSNGAAIMAESEKMARDDVGQRQRLADVDLAASKLERGMERQNIQPDVTAAMARIVAEKRDTSVPQRVGDFFRMAGTFGVKSGIDVRAEQEAAANLRGQAGLAPEPESLISRTMRYASPLGGMMAPLIGEGVRNTTGQTAGEATELRRMIQKQQETVDAIKSLKPKSGPPTVLPGRDNTGSMR